MAKKQAAVTKTSIKDVLDILNSGSMSNLAVTTITAIKQAGDMNTGMGPWPAGYLKQLFLASGANTPPTKSLSVHQQVPVDEMSDLIDSVNKAADHDLVKFPDALAAELAFDIMKSDETCALERANLRHYLCYQ